MAEFVVECMECGKRLIGIEAELHRKITGHNRFRLLGKEKN